MTTTYYTYNPTTRTLAPAPKAVRTAQGIAAVKQLLGWDDAKVAAVLDAAVIGGRA